MTTYTPELGDRICAEMIGGADGTLKSLRTICDMPGMPSRSTIQRWLREQPQFQEQYKLALIERTDCYAEDAVEVASDTSDDFYIDEEGKRRPNTANVQRSRLVVDTIKWSCAVMNPKKYGPKMDMTHANPDGGPVRLIIE